MRSLREYHRDAAYRRRRVGLLRLKMVLQEENKVDAAKEKHVPVIEKIKGGVLVKVGSVEHPMIDTHYIEWIEIITDKKVYREYLNPGDKPQAEFMLNEVVLYAREYCNIHHLCRS